MKVHFTVLTLRTYRALELPRHVAQESRPAGPALLPLRALARDQQPSFLVPALATCAGRAPCVLTQHHPPAVGTERERTFVLSY